MELHINNKLNKKAYIHLLNKEYKELDYRLINSLIDLDLNNIKYIYFTSNDLKSEIIILSKNLSMVELIEDNNKINVLIKNYNDNNYGRVETFILEDKKNLFFREDFKKKIHVLLPNDYSDNKQYGVILMFDAQNIFTIEHVGEYTKKNDPYGGWQVDVALKSIKDNQYIVVGIENADKYREVELTPSQKEIVFKDILFELNEEGLLHGELDSFRNFINDTLFPFIENKYSINKDEIGIAGSSCGGLASFYVGLKDYLKYKFIFTFTPATGFIKEESLIKLYRDVKFINNVNNLPYLFYYQGNKGDLEHLLYEVNKNLINVLTKEGYPLNLIESYIEESADHNEIMWRYGFSYAINKYIEFKESKDGR